ncbi:class I SAM-dependent methyltransferase [Aeromicrobium terrae]|uniref:Class I SAM-dependent methyltransferase n=1 Tax=Aeromicrobium terrae TaxID=2498846 RepID=A0A5C8NK98_9ACTN|nr:class I SAM-dependent methyltransferase [Aeromicrobium terrae]TXL60883.1 class I SAM-dependent methyltransferase [Aeromicrobium terrae]
MSSEPTQHTIASYEAIVDDYAEETAGPAVLASGLTALAEAVPGGHALEVGSGPGWDADVLEEAGLTVRRTDLTEGFIRFQRDRGKQVDRLDVVADDLGGPYDAVMALHVLQHVPTVELPAVLAKVAGALRPDGCFLVSIPRGEGEGWETGESGSRYYRALHTKDELLGLLRDAGLEPEWTDQALDEESGWLCVLARR